MRTAVPWAVFAVALAALLIGRSHDSQAGPMEGRVVRVVDGDTIKVRLDGGRTERVRYIGIDTPGSLKPNTRVQCFAEQASHFNASLVSGRAVTLRTDAEARGRYGCLLAFVYAGGRFLNRELVARGYA